MNVDTVTFMPCTLKIMTRIMCCFADGGHLLVFILLMIARRRCDEIFFQLFLIVICNAIWEDGSGSVNCALMCCVHSN